MNDPKNDRPRRRGLSRQWVFTSLAVLGVGLGICAGIKAADYQRSPKAAAQRSWHGKVTRIARSGADATGGLTARTASGATTPMVEGAEVSAGLHLVTDARTRARVELDDGTVLVLDRATDLAVLDGPRTMEVEGGALVADVAHIEGAPNARFLTKSGELSVLGTKFSLTAGDDRTSVEVMRGAVALKDASDAVEVNAGQEGVAQKGSRLEVTPANDLAQRVAFGERLGTSPTAHDEDTDAPTSGLGELRARRPGKTDEKDHAVRLAAHAVKVRVVGEVARTEIDETFNNDTGDDLEGVYRFPLPPGAQIERLALEVDGALVDGSFVDKAKAAAIFRGAIHNATPQAPKPVEEIVWVPGPWRDPALLEWQRGGRFELKIFPIPKRGSRRIVIAYTESVAPVAGMRRYVYPLPQATSSDIKIDNFAVDVQVLGNDPKFGVHVRGYELSRPEGASGPERLSQSMTGFTPSGDLVVEYMLKDQGSELTSWAFTDAASPAAPPLATDKKATVALPAGNTPYVALALRPRLPHWTDVRSRDQVLLIDAGRSMFGERFARARRLAEQLTQEMDRRDRVTVLACDVVCRSMPGGWKAPGPGTAHDVDAFLAGLVPEGASDLVGALRSAAAVDGRDAQHDLRVVLVSDGVASAGYRRLSRVAGEVEAALPDGRAEVVTVPIGTDADVPTLQEIARGGGGVVVPYAPGEPLETAALDVLNATYGVTLRDVTLTLPDGLSEVAPSVLPPMRAGGESLVLARMNADHVEGEAVLRGNVGGEPFEARYPLDLRPTTDAGNAFVPRLYAAARIADRERDSGDAARAELVQLSQRFRVPSRFTSLLVLESEAMFQAFGIDRTGPAAAWTGETAAVQNEAVSPHANAEEKAKAPVDEGLAANAYGDLSTAAGGGSLGADGFGSGGGGFGAGRASTPARPSPKVAGASAPRDDRKEELNRGDPLGGTITVAPSATSAPFTPQPPPSPRRRTGQWMRREWFRRSSVSADATPAIASDKVASARAALLAAPDERSRYRDLVRALAVNGALDELAETTDRWSARDPLDADAILARADLLARRGDRDGALRVLSGIASSTRAVTPADGAAMEASLAVAFERAGKAEACAFRIAAAELLPENTDAVARAVACERARGREARADVWLSAVTKDTTRSAIAAQAAKLGAGAATERASFGDVVVDATWDGAPAADLDIVVVDPAGNRLAWAGRTKGTRVTDPTGRTHEALGLSTSAAGPFSVEIVRADATSTVPVRGTLTVRSLGASMTRDFVLTAARVPVARVNVSWDSRLVPVDDTPNCDPPFFFDASGRKRTKPECF